MFHCSVGGRLTAVFCHVLLRFGWHVDFSVCYNYVSLQCGWHIDHSVCHMLYSGFGDVIYVMWLMCFILECVVCLRSCSMVMRFPSILFHFSKSDVFYTSVRVA